MTVRSLDPQSALIVIDLQQGIVSLALAHPAAPVLSNARALAEAFRARGLPVVLVNVAGKPPGRTEQSRSPRDFPPGWTELVAELNRQPTDHCITKHSAGAFTNTGLEQHLRGLGVTQVVLAGISTSGGVESTARQAYELGFHVTLAADAMTDSSLESHLHSLTKTFPRLGESGTTRDVLDLLERSRV